ncbi:MAG TPA: imidazolonepropionase [Thermoanaerobaculia bacterium]|jgi:imidazolonepropionase|nr:imidazolonepropionase [Thermoanaerobaculia bacterium]
MTGDLLIENLAEVATAEGISPRRGSEQGRVRRTRHSEGIEVLCREGRIAFVGPAAERRASFGDLSDLPRLDGKRGTLIPGFVDPHTHIPWAGTRETELFERLAGKTYQAIAAEGGGILSTVAATRRASEDEITGNVLRHLDWMLAGGTTTIEAKSGYGLNLADEMKQLVALQRAAAEHPVRVLPTLLAAHEVPPEHRADAGGRARYVDLICDEIVPAVAARGLARFCDVFCEAGVFSPEESRRVLEAGIRHGLAPRLHADEFADSGGAELAAELGALSADHLMAVSERGIEALAGSGVTAVLLPGTSFFLKKERYAPARRMIEAGIPVALATDCNPGSSYTESMPMIVTLAVFALGLSVEESLTAATLNAACCLGVGDEVGTIEIGKRADLALLDAPNLLHLAYHYGVNPIAAVVREGRLVYRSGGRIV